MGVGDERRVLAVVDRRITVFLGGVESGKARPFDRIEASIIRSYGFAGRLAIDLRAEPFDLVVSDEAHRLRTAWRGASSQRAQALKDDAAGRFKLLPTATPPQDLLIELYGLVSVIDHESFGEKALFSESYVSGKGIESASPAQATGPYLQAEGAPPGPARWADQLYESAGADLPV